MRQGDNYSNVIERNIICVVFKMVCILKVKINRKAWKMASLHPPLPPPIPVINSPWVTSPTFDYQYLTPMAPVGVLTGKDLKDLFDDARAKGYAIPAVNCTS